MNAISKKIDQLLEWEPKKFVKLAQKGLIYLMIGLIILSIVIILGSFEYGNYEDLFEIIYKLINIGAIIVFYLGVLLFILSMFTIAIHDEDLHIYLRVALIITIGLMISVPLLTLYGI